MCNNTDIIHVIQYKLSHNQKMELKIIANMDNFGICQLNSYVASRRTFSMLAESKCPDFKITLNPFIDDYKQVLLFYVIRASLEKELPE